MPILGQSSYAKRGRTGRKSKKTKFVRTKVVHHRHRRYRGIHSQPFGSSARNRKKATSLVEKRRTARKLREPARVEALRSAARVAAKKRVFKGRVYKGRKVKPGLKRQFLGRKPLTYKRAFKGRVVPPGLKRVFKGRKPSTRPRITKIGSKTQAAIKAGAISQQSYINMF